MAEHRLAERPWRLLRTGARPGAFNMALDHALLLRAEEELERGGAPRPIFRLFAWDPPAISIGRLQSESDVDLAACRREGVDVVRRPTGGRAILHWQEVTYSMVVPLSLLGREMGIIASYRMLCEGLLAGLRLLGINAALARGKAREPRWGEGSAACFAVASRCDAVVDGRKLLGSAQARRRGVLLQHGSLPLLPRAARELKLLRCASPAEESGRATVADVLGRVPQFEEVAQALVAGLRETWGIALVADEPSAAELELAEQLISEALIVDADGAEAAGESFDSKDRVVLD